LQKKQIPSDEEDFNPYDFCGGNYDDAWEAGQLEGEVLLARELLDKFFKTP